jgi:AAA domain
MQPMNNPATLASRAAPPRFSMPPLLWGPAALAAAARPAAWLWHGFLAPGAVTLMTSQWKAGKTTLASVLLARMQTGGALAGLPLAAGKAVVVSEEGPELWCHRHGKLAFGEHIGWYCRPFMGKPKPEQWSDFVAGLADLHVQVPYSLLLIDPLAAFLPGSENDAGSVMDALAPLQAVTSRGVSALAMHHPRKGKPLIGQAARGSGALCSSADIIIEMRPGRRERRRRLWAWSRYAETPARLVIEWTADGSDYVACGSFEDEEFARRWRGLRAIFEAAPHKLTRKDVLLRWPEGGRRPNKVSLLRWLEHGLRQGLLRKDGLGLRNKPFRYWLPEREDVWRADPLACLLMPELKEVPAGTVH